MMVMVTITAAKPEAYAGPVAITIPYRSHTPATVTIIGIAGLHVVAPLSIPA